MIESGAALESVINALGVSVAMAEDSTRFNNE
jgi:hypothetical protein